MQKQRLFKITDFIIWLNIFMFSAIVIQTWNDQSPIKYIVFCFAFFNLIFIIETINLRRNFNLSIQNKLVNEVKAEENLDESTRENVNRMKQVLLENRVEAEISTKMPDARFIRNAYIPRNDGSFSEIDMIVISTLGIFIIECKNVTGIITGTWNQEYLNILHPGGTEYPMYNPIMQNDMHYKTLKNILGLRSELFRSVVVFGDNAQISNYREGKAFYAEICHLSTLIKSIIKLQERHKTTIESHIVESIYTTLEPYIRKTDEKVKSHVEKSKKKQIESINQ